jgi:hypothetical protein
LNRDALPHLFQEELYQFTAPMTVVVPRPWETYTQEEELLLAKILTSVKIDIGAVQMIEQAVLDLQALPIYSPTRVLIFGSASEDLPLYQVVPAQGFTVIRADDLAMLDDIKKKNLWAALRQMFGI